MRQSVRSISVIVPLFVVVLFGYQNCAQTFSATSSSDQQSSVASGSAMPESSQIFKTGQLATSDVHSCFVDFQGCVQCWGQNSSAQLGNGTTTMSDTPVKVSSLSNAVQISISDTHSCAVLANGELKCWGYGAYGQLGDGNASGSASTPVTAITSGVRQVSLGHKSYVSCALLNSGEVKCFGNLSQLMLTGLPVTSKSPVTVPVPPAVQLAIDDYRSCILQADGIVKCWGLNNVGQLGIGTTGMSSSLPVKVENLSAVKQISLGAAHACALLASGEVKCWGFGAQGQLGNGSKNDSPLPIAVSGLSNVVQIACGRYHSCALQSDGIVKCWGHNQKTLDYQTTPMVIQDFSDVKSISAAEGHFCAIHNNNDVNCWGL